MKRGQVEMIGLVVVVMLIVIAALFYVKYGILDKKPKSDIVLEQSFTSNLLNSLLNVGVCDEKIKMDEAIISCFNEQNWCASKNCDDLKNEIKDIINLVGLKKFKNYSVWVEDKGEEKYFVTGCNSGIKAYTTVKGQNKRTYDVNLQLC